MSNLLKYGLIAVGTTALFVTGLFVKNYVEEKNIKLMSKQQVVIILRKIRKDRYIVYKQIASFSLNLKQQLRNNINQDMIKQFINGPQSPLKIQEEFETIQRNVCEASGIKESEFATSLERYRQQREIAQYLQQEREDMTISLKGSLPGYRVEVPAHLSKQKFYQIQREITKKAYLQQVKIFRKLQQYSELELNQNPSLLKELGNPQAEIEEILVEQGLQTEFEPASAVFQSANQKYSREPNFRNEIQRIEVAYQKIMRKYTLKLQNKTITDRELNEMEDEIIFCDPNLS